MQEVFEKIIERLEKETDCHNCSIYCADADICGFEEMKKQAKQIVQEAEKYNNGWIPCSERLPEEYTVLCCDKYGEMIIGHPYFDEVSDTNYSSESDNEMMYNCVAWQPLPQPYQPNGEVDGKMNFKNERKSDER